MPAIDYVSIARDAADAIRDAGQEVAVRRLSDRVFDPVEGEYTGGSGSVDTPVRAVVVPSLPGWVSLRSRDLIEPGDEFLLMEAGVIEPELSDLIFANGQVFKIVDLERLAPADVPVLYTLHMRP